jgi:hypothetical protein
MVIPAKGILVFLESSVAISEGAIVIDIAVAKHKIVRSATNTYLFLNIKSPPSSLYYLLFHFKLH